MSKVGLTAGLGAEDYDRKYGDIELFRRIAKLFLPYKRFLAISSILMAIGSILNAFGPLVLREALNSLELSTDMTRIALLIIFALVLNLLYWIFDIFQSISLERATQNVIFDIREQSYKKVLNHDLSFFDHYSSGKIVSRIISDCASIGTSVSIILSSISSFLVVFILIGVMFVISWQLTLVIFSSIPIMIVITFIFRKLARKWTLLGQRSLANINDYLQQTMSGIQIIKNFRQEKQIFSKFIDMNDQAYYINLRTNFILNIILPILNIVQSIALVVFIYFAGNSLLTSQVQIGDIYFYLQNLTFLFNPLLTLAGFWPRIQQGLSAAERVFSLVDHPTAVIQNDKIKPTKFSGKIFFDNITFGYNKQSTLFKNFSLKIRAGESIAIVGHTGAGKSSLTKLLSRFYEFQEGDIFIDGVSIRDFDLETYRMNVGLIPQTPFLWADTLENNIKYGAPLSSQEKVLWALEEIGDMNWVKNLPNGLHTNIYERGNLLSMGQKQIVAFARLLLKDPAIVILDEATASIDPFTEVKIQSTLEKIMKNRTVIVIAHRLWTVQHVDRIVVLDRGKIIEEGKHDELLAQKGYYSRLYDKYFRHQSLGYIKQAKIM